MKRLLLLALLIGLLTPSGNINAQDILITPTLSGVGEYHGLTPPLKDLPVLTEGEMKVMFLESVAKNLNPKLETREYPFSESSYPHGPDQAWQKKMGKIPNTKAPVMNFNGQQSPYYPPDANGTVGHNYYMQTINCVYTIYDNTTGAIVAGPTNMNELFSGVTGANYNDGDPIVLFDDQADRWLAAEFSIDGSNDYMLMAVSTTNDPTGTWHKYSFDVADMPDYEKFGIWRDGYYMGTNNSSGNDTYVFERDQMLIGGTAQMVGFNNAWRPSTIDGFMCVPPVDNDGVFADAGSPGLFITLNDDAIGGGSDELWIYELDVNWSSPSSSSFNRVQQLGVTSFDSNFGSNWDNIKQLGTSRELDAIPMVIMNKPQYRNFGSYESIICCHTVDVDATDHAGIRWYELRRTTGSWYVRQSGTYAPDSHSRWMGSIALNGNGELGMGYSISSSTMYPGIRYCGQSASAYASASGVLDIAEEVIQNGSSSQTGANRWGDYASISVDPDDDQTFWFTTEYGGSRQSKIASFQFAPAPLLAEFTGSPLTVCPGGSVSFFDQSTGTPSSWSWTFTGGTPANSSAQNPVVTYNTSGIFAVSLSVGDGSSNDTETKTAYVTVSDIVADFSGSPTNVTVGNSVSFNDLTTCDPTSWSWSFSGGTPSTSTAQNPVISYNSIGSYNVTLTAANAAGNDVITKSGYINVSEVSINYCASQGNNVNYEWISNVGFGEFSNSSGATMYSDFTNLTVNMTAGESIAVSLTPAFASTLYVEYWRIWIDYNKDGDFTDTGEEVFAPASSNTTVSGNFNVSSIASGTTRMRVAMKWNGVPTSCETFSYGEVEDYTVSFGSPSPPVADFTASPTTIVEGESVQFTDLTTNGPTSWAWTFTAGTPSSSTAQNPTVTFNTAGVYDVSLSATSSAGSDTEIKTSYITVVVIPSCVSVVGPTEGANNILITDNLEWNTDADATGYTLYFGTNSPPTNIVNGTDLSNATTYNPTGDMAYNTTYYWQVVPSNANGSASGCDIWSFTTEEEVLPVPGCANLLSPASGATDVSIMTNLDWEVATYALGYDLYFGTDNPPTNIVNGSDLGDLTLYNPSGDLSYNTTYYWNIVPYNNSSSASGCSVWSFTTEVEPIGGSVQLSFTDFESGWGIWTDGGKDCNLYTLGTYASQGNNAGDIQDNSGVGSSFYHTNGVDIHTSGYVQIDVKFDFIPYSMDKTTEDFWVQYFDGTTWHTVASYAKGIDFENGNLYEAKVNIFESDYNFPTGMKIRFMCDASGNNDDVYIDQVDISASTTLIPDSYLVQKGSSKVFIADGGDEIQVYPNPVQTILNIDVAVDDNTLLHIYDMSGKLIFTQKLTKDDQAIDMGSFENGMYIIYIISDGESYSKKIIKN